MPYCGDGFLDFSAGEQCDDGNTADGDFCSSTCLEGECIIAPNSCPAGEICLSGGTSGSPTFCAPEGTLPPP